MAIKMSKYHLRQIITKIKSDDFQGYFLSNNIKKNQQFERNCYTKNVAGGIITLETTK